VALWKFRLRFEPLGLPPLTKNLPQCPFLYKEKTMVSTYMSPITSTHTPTSIQSTNQCWASIWFVGWYITSSKALTKDQIDLILDMKYQGGWYLDSLGKRVQRII